MSNGFLGLAPEERIITALDMPRDEAIALADKLAGTATWLKVGMTLYYKEGPQIVSELQERGFKVFLDLKFHDIPHQVRGAAKSAVASGADMLTMHTVGAAEMCRAAREGAEEAAREAGLSGVVASPQEAAMLREVLGPDAYIVTPGVRPAGAALGDQKRVATPARAVADGASHIVVGRPITQADDPVAVFNAIAEELREGVSL